MEPESFNRKRRAITHGQKACNPCRLRKVKCSYQSPCQTCVERQHPELCQYEAPLKRVRLAPTPTSTGTSPSAGQVWMPSRNDWEALSAKIDTLQQTLQAVSKDLGRRKAPSASDDSAASVDEDEDDGLDNDISHDIHTTSQLTGETVFLGGSSMPAAVAAALGQSEESDAVRNLLGGMPIFTLENDSATYPFIDLWGLPHTSSARIEQLCALLPTHSECLQYLRQYRDTAHVLFPGIVMMQRFEAEVASFLMTRTAQSTELEREPMTAENVYGKSVHWLGLFFASLASGCQCSNMPRRDRQLTSQVYVCCAYECLRIINYLSCSQLEDIQNLLVIGNVISNTMNAGVAWSLLGLTIRLAQGIGLHHSPPAQTSMEERTAQHEIWSRIIWQDSLLSITYDRATPTTAMTQWDSSNSPICSYVDCMLQLCTIALDVVCNRTSTTSTHREVLRIDERRKKIVAIEQQAHPHLKDASACASMRDHLEHWNWTMHRSYVVSELCRPMVARRRRRHHDDSSETLREVCIEALADTVEAFLNLHNLTSFASTSWAAVHRSLSSALLLAILGEPRRRPRVQVLLDRLIAVMSSGEYADSAEIPAPIARSVAALVRLNVNDSGSGSGMNSSWMSETGSTTGGTDLLSPHAEMYRILWGSFSSPGGLSSLGD